MKGEDKKSPNGFTVRTDKQLNNFLRSLKRQTGAPSIKALIEVMLRCPQLPSYVFDHFAKTSFEIDDATKKAYETENRVSPSGTYKAIYIKKPQNGRVVVE